MVSAPGCGKAVPGSAKDNPGAGQKWSSIRIQAQQQQAWQPVTSHLLSCQPSFERSVPPPVTVHSAGRTVFIGASNMSKIAKAAAENGHMVVDLTGSG